MPVFRVRYWLDTYYNSLHPCPIPTISCAAGEETLFLPERSESCSGKNYLADLSCTSCGEICGDDVNCRVWEYEGNQYEVPPVGFLVDALLKGVYAPESLAKPVKEYTVPDNIRTFFAGTSD